MGNVFTLDSMREELEKEYAPTQFDIGTEVITVRNIIRMKKNERKKVQELISELAAIEEDENHTEEQVVEKVGQILTAAADAGKGKKLLTAIGDDVPLLMRVFRAWTDSEPEMGEASDSPN